MADSILQVENLVKHYGNVQAVRGVSFHVDEGEVFGLLGPNGAGKTTTVQILSTLMRADAGDIRVAGFDVSRERDRVRDAIGVTGQFSSVDYLLSGRENLMLMADLHHLDRLESRRRVGEMLTRFDLVEAAGQMVMKYSGGMRRRLDLAMTLISEPRILFLDEPTTGLDPRSRHTMWQITRELVAGGVTVLLTTQNLDEADELAGRIAVLDEGRLVAEGTPDELKRRIPGGRVRLHFRERSALSDAARALGRQASDDDALVLDLPTDGSPESLRNLLNRIDDHALGVENVTVETPDLDDVFFALTGARHHVAAVTS
jgi:ABC-2 type transport system ATP-binding protein